MPAEPFSANRLIEEYYSQLKIYASRMLNRFPPVKRWEETDDVAHLSFMRLLKALESTEIQSELHFRRLAGLQVRRLLIDLARSFSGPNGIDHNHETHHGLSPDPMQTGDGELGPVELTLADWEIFHSLIDQLEEDDREMFDLLWYSGLSVQQVATLFSVTPRSIQRRWRKARLAVSRSYQGRQLPVPYHG